MRVKAGSQDGIVVNTIGEWIRIRTFFLGLTLATKLLKTAWRFRYATLLTITALVLYFTYGPLWALSVLTALALLFYGSLIAYLWYYNPNVPLITRLDE